MQIAFGDYAVATERFETRDQMRGYLDRCESGHLWLGEEGEGRSRCDVAVVTAQRDAGYRFGLGIASEDHGLTPQILLHTSEPILLVGYGTSAAAVRFPEGRLLGRVELPFLFYRFAPTTRPGIVLGVCELGLSALTLEGAEVWVHTADDIVTDCQVEGDRVRILLFEGEAVTLRLDDGLVC